ncbi:MAG: RNA-binding domain-containing protein, partial [Bullifex sp.]
MEELVDSVMLEDESFEAKSILNRDDTVSWLKTIAGFANASGGDFFIGVEDKTNKLIGFDRKGADNERNFFNNQVNEHLTPRPSIRISFLRYTIKGSERFVIRVHVDESPVKPVVLKYKGIPSIYMRRDGYTNGATYEEIIEMSIRSKNMQYDSLVSDVKYDPEKFSELRAFFRNHNDGAELKEKALMSLGFFNEEGYLSNGAVPFQDGYEGNKTEVQCSVFSGFNKGSERIVTINRFRGNITSTIEYIVSFVKQRMNHSVLKLSDTRENIDSYPSRALFEGVVNAVAHRDYYLDGTQIQVDMFRDRLEISSPGSFYRGDKPGRTYDLSGIISKRRNDLISGVLVLCNVMEAAGTGFDKIMEE